MKALNRTGNRKTINGNRYHKQTGSNLKPVYPKTGLQNGSKTGLENGSQPPGGGFCMMWWGFV